LRGLSAAVADHLHISGQKVPQAVNIAIAKRIEEARREFLPLPPIGLEPRTALVHVAPRPQSELPAGCLRTQGRSKIIW